MPRTAQQVALLEEELEATRHAARKGPHAASPRSPRIKRTLIEAEGQIGRLEAEIGEIEELSRKYEMQIEQAVRQHQQTALDDLQPIQAELDSIREQLRAARNVRERTDVIAPVSGTVVRLHYHTAGGVIESGRADRRDPAVGAAADHRGAGAAGRYRQRAQGPAGDDPADRAQPPDDAHPVWRGDLCLGRLGRRNPDGMPQEVYIARVSMPASQMRRVPNFTPTPGMPAEIMIQTAERTFAQYLVKPIKDSLGRAFREQ